MTFEDVAKAYRAAGSPEDWRVDPATYYAIFAATPPQLRFTKNDGTLNQVHPCGPVIRIAEPPPNG